MENNEENKMKEAEILEKERDLEEPEEDFKKNKYDFYIELALFFILGILLGITLKNEAVKRITIGFDDYKMNIQRSDFDINQIEKDILEKQKEEQEQQDQENQGQNSESQVNSEADNKTN